MSQRPRTWSDTVGRDNRWMAPPPTSEVVAFGIGVGALVLTGGILRFRRDITGPPLGTFVDGVWIASLCGLFVLLAVVWILDLGDRWLVWPLAIFELSCLALTVWDTVTAVRASRGRHRAD